MPRKSRIDAPGALHHVIMRGIERSPLFRDAKDRENFIARLGGLLTETSTSCYAWVLMENHVHLLLRSGLCPLSTLMRRLLTGYAQQVNRRHNRSGHLFQNRYKSILCEEEPYLLELVRYIHLNPIRAHAVEDMAALERYPWCGHGVVMGRREQAWQDDAFVLRLFHEKQGPARRAYAAFVKKGVALGRRPDLVGGGFVRSAGGRNAVHALRRETERSAGDERILGGSAFVLSVLAKADEEYAARKTAANRGFDLQRLVTAVCTHVDLHELLLTSPGKERRVSRVRAVIAHIAFHVLRLKGVDIADHLNLSPAAVSRLAQRGRRDPLSETIGKALFGKEGE